MMAEQEEFGTIWDHFEDLRHTLIRIFAVVAIGFIGFFSFYESLFQFVTYPLNKNNDFIVYSIRQERIVNPDLRSSVIYSLPVEATMIQLSAGTKQIAPSIFELPPHGFIDYSLKENKHRLLILSPLEGMIMAFKLCFWLSLACTSPIWAYLALQFVLPGLKAQEKGLIVPFLAGSLLCLAAGACFAYYFTIPFANAYFQKFNTVLGINEWALSHYIDYTLILLLGHAVAFELGLLLFLVVHAGKISPEALKCKRRYFMISAFIIGALLTPPDVFTQLMLAIPLIVLYELVILYSRMRVKLTKFNV